MSRSGACFSMLLLAHLNCPAAVIDRLAVSVGKQVITESEVDMQVRITALLNADELDLSSAQKHQAAERLVEQTLLRREMESSDFMITDDSNAAASWSQLETAWGEEKLRDALKRYGLTEQQVKQHLLWQDTVLRFIEYRFKPAVQVSEAAIQRYYNQQSIEWKKAGHNPVPTLEDARADIENILTAERADRALDRWLGAQRTQTEILFHDEAFR